MHYGHDVRPHAGAGAPITPDIILRTSYSGLAKWLTATDGGEEGSLSAAHDAQPSPSSPGARCACHLNLILSHSPDPKQNLT